MFSVGFGCGLESSFALGCGFGCGFALGCLVSLWWQGIGWKFIGIWVKWVVFWMCCVLIFCASFVQCIGVVKSWFGLGKKSFCVGNSG